MRLSWWTLTELAFLGWDDRFTMEIPPKWRGQVTTRRTINGRVSKLTGKLRRAEKRKRPMPEPQISEWE